MIESRCPICGLPRNSKGHPSALHSKQMQAQRQANPRPETPKTDPRHLPEKIFYTRQDGGFYKRERSA